MDLNGAVATSTVASAHFTTLGATFLTHCIVASAHCFTSFHGKLITA